MYRIGGMICARLHDNPCKTTPTRKMPLTRYFQAKNRIFSLTLSWFLKFLIILNIRCLTTFDRQFLACVVI